MLTEPTRKPDPKKYKEEALAGLTPVHPTVYSDFIWGLRFGKYEKRGMVWKYGSPWLYPKHEFEMLKTIVTVEELTELEKLLGERTAKPNVVAALGISEAQKEQNKKLSGSMAKFFKELPA